MLKMISSRLVCLTALSPSKHFQAYVRLNSLFISSYLDLPRRCKVLSYTFLSCGLPFTFCEIFGSSTHLTLDREDIPNLKHISYLSYVQRRVLTGGTAVRVEGGRNQGKSLGILMSTWFPPRARFCHYRSSIWKLQGSPAFSEMVRDTETNTSIPCTYLSSAQRVHQD